MVSYWIMDYSFGVSGDGLFVVNAGDGRGGVVTRTANLYYQKVYCWLDGGDFVSSQSRDYTYMSHSNKDNVSSSPSLGRDYQFIDYGDGRGGVGPRTNHF